MLRRVSNTWRPLGQVLRHCTVEGCLFRPWDCTGHVITLRRCALRGRQLSSPACLHASWHLRARAARVWETSTPVTNDWDVSACSCAKCTVSACQIPCDVPGEISALLPFQQAPPSGRKEIHEQGRWWSPCASSVHGIFSRDARHGLQNPVFSGPFGTPWWWFSTAPAGASHHS